MGGKNRNQILSKAKTSVKEYLSGFSASALSPFNYFGSLR